MGLQEAYRALFLLQCFILFVECRVNIVLDYSPPYMQTGKNMSLLCSSKERYELNWSNLTTQFASGFSTIVPKLGGPYIIRKLYEEPSGYVESILIKQNLSLEDTGSYQCSDNNRISSFSVYVTVLQIMKEDVKVTSGAYQVRLSCEIGGFRTNIPEMAYLWLYKGMLIPDSHSTKYSTSHSDTLKSMSLTINDIGSQDTGYYQCVFILSISFGRPFNASEYIFVDATDLPTSDATKLHSIFVLYFVNCLITLMMTHLHLL